MIRPQVRSRAYTILVGGSIQAHDAAAKLEADANQAMQREDWNTGIVALGKMLGALPSDETHRSVRLQLQLAIDSAKAHQGQQLDSIKSLEDVLQRLDGDPVIAPQVLSDVRRQLGSLHYYNAWLLRLQGAPTGLWTGEAERARQQFRYLADGSDRGPTAEADTENVERVIRLEQLDLSELRGRKLPKPAQGMDQRPSDQSLEEQKNLTKPKSSDISKKTTADDQGRPGAVGFISNHSLTGS